MSSTLEASVFMGKNYSDNLHPIKKNPVENLIEKQMFDISEKLTVEQSDEIFVVSQINWEDYSLKQLSLVNDEEVISLSHEKGLCFLRFCVMSWKGANQNPASNTAWE